MKEVRTLSTIVAVKKDNQIVIGADTMFMLGGTKQSSSYIKNSSKIIYIEGNYLAFIGIGSWSLVLKSYFQNLSVIPSLKSVDEIFRFSLELHDALKEQYYLNPNEEEDDPFESSQLDCLIANSTGIYGLYSLRTVQEYTKFYSFGSGYKFAMGAMRAVYDSYSAEEIARKGLEAAADFDDSTGLPLELYTIEIE